MGRDEESWGESRVTPAFLRNIRNGAAVPTESKNVRDESPEASVVAMQFRWFDFSLNNRDGVLKKS